VAGLPSEWGAYRFDSVANDQYATRTWSDARWAAVSPNLVFDQALFECARHWHECHAYQHWGFRITSPVTLTIPDLGFVHTRMVSLGLTQTDVFTYSVTLPENLAAGPHAVEVELDADSMFNRTFSFWVPEPQVQAFVDRAYCQAGEGLPVRLINLGGVDAVVVYTLTLRDATSQVNLLQDTPSLVLQAGATDVVSGTFPAGIRSGSYIAQVEGLVTPGDSAVSLRQSVQVAGPVINLAARTDRAMYLTRTTLP